MRTADAHSVADLVFGSFEAGLRPYIVYCQPGVDSYLTEITRRPEVFPDYDLYVAEDSFGQICCFAEFRSVGKFRSLLSYICVAVPARGHGLARRTLLYHLGSEPSIATVELDVFSHNDVAKRLYGRLGFTYAHSTYWWRRSLVAVVGAHGEMPQVTGWHGSIAALDRYGFCRLTVEYEGRKSAPGLTSASVLRVEDRNDFLDSRYLAGLHELFPTTREAMVIDSGSTTPLPESELLLRSIRMVAPVAAICADRT